MVDVSKRLAQGERPGPKKRSSIVLSRAPRYAKYHSFHTHSKLAWESGPGREQQSWRSRSYTSHQTGMEKFSRAKSGKGIGIFCPKQSICSSLNPTPQAVAIITSRSHTLAFLTTQTQRPTQPAQQILFRHSWQLHHQSASASPEAQMA